MATNKYHPNVCAVGVEQLTIQFVCPLQHTHTLYNTHLFLECVCPFFLFLFSFYDLMMNALQISLLGIEWRLECSIFNKKEICSLRPERDIRFFECNFLQMLHCSVYYTSYVFYIIFKL